MINIIAGFTKLVWPNGADNWNGENANSGIANGIENAILSVMEGLCFFGYCVRSFLLELSPFCYTTPRHALEAMDGAGCAADSG